MRQLYALILGTSLCVPSLALAATPSDEGQRPALVTREVTSQQAAPRAAAESPQKAKQDERARYAAKEKQSGEAKDYRGGDTVVLGATAVTAILAVLLLVILI
jgi:hypothetical protein